MREGSVIYLGAWLDITGFKRIFRDLCDRVGLGTVNLPDGVRVRETASERFWFNFDTVEHRVDGKTLAPISVTRETWA